MHNTTSIFLTDSYKLAHADQYPEGTELVFSNFTPRGDKYAPSVCKDKGVVVFGTTLALTKLDDHFHRNFFKNDIREEMALVADKGPFHKQMIEQELKELKDSVIKPIKKKIELFLGQEYDMSRIEALWDLGYLPISVRALEEGTICPIKIPMLTIHNTLPEFFWLPNFLETILSAYLWKPITSATIAKGYKRIIDKWALKTTGSTEGTVFQGHDFSMRGLDGEEATIASGLGHLTSFWGTDSLPTLEAAEYYYEERGFIAASVPATEHSVMCAGGKESELETYNRILNIHPTGFISIVSDTWDLWNVLTNILPQLKDKIMSRQGRLVVRPDSGDPVDILCGELHNRIHIIELPTNYHKGRHYINNSDYRDILKIEFDEIIDDYLVKDENGDLYEVRFQGDESSDTYFTVETKIGNIFDPKYIGVIELLWDLFGGTINEQGYKVLDSHIGLIYGDSITPERCEEICKRLEAKGFASTNVVFGIGSYTYQYNTRDTFGFAMKATYVEKKVKVSSADEVHFEVVGESIFKDPVTDDGLKKSAKGLLAVAKDREGNLKVIEEASWEEVKTPENMLKLLYEDGAFFNTKTFSEIRETLKNIE